MSEAPPPFPALPGQGWSVHKRPTFATRLALAPHVSAGRCAPALYAAPLWEFEVTFDGLASGSAFPGLGANSLQTLLGLSCAARVASGPSSTRIRPTACLSRPARSGSAMGQRAPSRPRARSAASPSRSGWVTACAPSQSTVCPPAAGASPRRTGSCCRLRRCSAVIGADFDFAYLCRFLDDVQDFENVMAGLWKAEGVKFRSVRT